MTHPGCPMGAEGATATSMISFRSPRPGVSLVGVLSDSGEGMFPHDQGIYGYHTQFLTRSKSADRPQDPHCASSQTDGILRFWSTGYCRDRHQKGLHTTPSMQPENPNIDCSSTLGSRRSGPTASPTRAPVCSIAPGAQHRGDGRWR